MTSIMLARLRCSRSATSRSASLTAGAMRNVTLASGRLTGLRMIPTQVRRFRVNGAAEADTRWLRDRLNREGERFGIRSAERRTSLRTGGI